MGINRQAHSERHLRSLQHFPAPLLNVYAFRQPNGHKWHQCLSLNKAVELRCQGLTVEIVCPVGYSPEFRPRGRGRIRQQTLQGC